MRQVAAVVQHLVSRGNGTHRITVTLQPEHLGEVRVTLVVRDGSVRVSLAAEQAKDALRQGAPELQRLLEAGGASESRVVVRDLQPTTSSTGPSTDAHRGVGERGTGSPAGDAEGRHGDGRQRQDHRGPRGVLPSEIPTRAGAPAPTPATPSPGRLDRTV